MQIWITVLIAVLSVAVGGLLTWIFGRIQQIRLLHDLRDAVIAREHVSVNEEFLMTRLLAETIQKEDYVPDVIFAISPGGAMIAEWLARRFLGNRSSPIPVQILNMTRVPIEGETGSKIKLRDELSPVAPGLPKDAKILIVNDISRTGHTLDAASDFLSSQMPEATIKSGVLICHKQTRPSTYFAAVTTKTIQFDWKHYDD